MKAKRINKYRKYNDKINDWITVYVYKVIQATPEQLEDYETTQAENFVADEDGLPLFFSAQFEGNVIDLEKSKAKDKKGNLIDVYKAVSSEDFELKKSVIQQPTQQYTAVTVKPLEKAQKGSIMQAINTDPIESEGEPVADGADFEG